MEPFLPGILNHNKLPTAYPPTRDNVYSPLFMFYAWPGALLDDSLINGIKESAKNIRDAAITEGQDIKDAPLYPNYATFDTPLKEMYGDNVGELMLLKQRVDPTNIMGLAGGFRF